jgi:hypothetical protein
MSKPKVRVCIDKRPAEHRIIEAAHAATKENVHNAPLGVGRGSPELHKTRIASVTKKRWAPGRTLRVRFLEGDPTVQARVASVAKQWSQYANVKLEFGNDPQAEIRIAFDMTDGSWSYIGTDALLENAAASTMNYGWLEPSTPDDEVGRVVLHEFGHALGAIHEHQSPDAGIPWDREAVYAYYMGPPNNWTRADVDSNIFDRYSATTTQYSKFDPDSIMLYAVDNALTIGNYEIGWNRVLSAVDKQYMAAWYPQQAPVVTSLTMDAASVQASIAAPGEIDLFKFVAPSDGKYRVQTTGQTDTVMGLYGPDSLSTLVAEDDDSGYAYNARIATWLSAGTYYVRVRHYGASGTGTYRIAVRRL